MVREKESEWTCEEDVRILSFVTHYGLGKKQVIK